MLEMKLTPFEVHSVVKEKTDNNYGLDLLEIPDIRMLTDEKGKGIVVAVLDTGIDKEHQALKNKIIGGVNFTGEGRVENFSDGNGHGTHVAGIIANVAPEAHLLACKVLDSRGSGSYDSIVNGIQFATNWRGPKGERVRVINMSLGGPVNDRRLEKAILDACAQGINVCVASGNEGDGNDQTFEHSFPALYNECVCVGAIDSNSKIAYFSNQHLQMDILAPGVEILSTYPQNKYAVLSGTSMATPFISGCMALVVNIGEKQFRRSLNREEIYSLLVKCCCSLGYKKSTEGNGLPKMTQILKEC
jgi:major intracellular serine protease